MIQACDTKQKLKVLIVDDSSLIISRLRRLLANAENVSRFSDAHDFEEGKFLFDQEDPDVVLLDINLPAKSGLDLLIYIRQTHKETKIIMLTNEAASYYRKLSLSLGADYFVDKAYEFEKLPDILFNL
ncbi:MAG: response regulator [Bacteroidota bacterium]|nr:response regulator [Bacteroidota bacterium]